MSEQRRILKYYLFVSGKNALLLLWCKSEHKIMEIMGAWLAIKCFSQMFLAGQERPFSCSCTVVLFSLVLMFVIWLQKEHLMVGARKKS